MNYILYHITTTSNTLLIIEA
jgi:hypothetical protein